MKELKEILLRRGVHNTDLEKEILDLFIVTKRFRCSWWDEDENKLAEYFWAKDKEDVYLQVLDLNPKATYLICDQM